MAGEASPYLRQHADNPVDWWPWCDEAFAEARRRDVPVLISVGYSACHWCHVMAHESFEDTEVAAVLNAGFVAVKVDREERPDVDAVYMEAVQLVSGGGGWPMTVLATADGRPFWAGTYLPKASFLRLLRQVANCGRTSARRPRRRSGPAGRAVRQGAELLPMLGGRGQADGAVPDAAAIDVAALSRRRARSRTVTAAYGAGRRSGPGRRGAPRPLRPPVGRLGGAPKFPQPTTLEVLAQYWWRSGDGALRAPCAAHSTP